MVLSSVKTSSGISRESQWSLSARRRRRSSKAPAQLLSHRKHIPSIFFVYFITKPIYSSISLFQKRRLIALDSCVDHAEQKFLDSLVQFQLDSEQTYSWVLMLVNDMKAPFLSIRTHFITRFDKAGKLGYSLDS